MIHREGLPTIFISILFAGLLYWIGAKYLSGALWFFSLVGIVLLIIVLQFFRNPKRIIPILNDKLVYAPADGKVVVIEETQEDEYFKSKRLMISVFMSPINVHVNRNPISGTVQYSKYHPGKYLVAWHPKSSTENERTSVVLKNGNNEILLRQIAGALARRIVNYLKAGDEVKQGSEMGFIKFGSRVDIYLPLDAKIKVAMNQVVYGNLDVIAELP